MPMTFDVPEIHCDACVRSITAAVHGVAPGATVKVDIPARHVMVEPAIDPDRIVQAIEEAGFTVAGRG